MVRGKMAKEDIFAEIGTTALYSKYIFGELTADFLDWDSEIDITTSSRQDFFEDDERYIALKEFVKKSCQLFVVIGKMSEVTKVLKRLVSMLL